MASSAAASGSGLWRRPSAMATPSARPPVGALRLDVDPPPSLPRPLLRVFGVGLIALFACLQFLPATHFRDPSDPHRTWIPFDGHRTALVDSGAGPPETIHVYSWVSCLDLRQLAVLANSTLSNSRFQDHVHFHFIIPEKEDMKMTYYKLKVLFPVSDFDVIGQKKIIQELKTLAHEEEIVWPSLHEIAPLIIPTINPSLSKFIYISPDTIVKGSIEELFGIDLGPYAIAVAEDCTKRLGDYVDVEILNAIQRAASKSWISKEPYDRNACMLDFTVLVIDTKKFEKIFEPTLWWSKVLSANERSHEVNLAIRLALNHRHLNLSSGWKRHDSLLSDIDEESRVLRFDGPRRVCSEQNNQDQGSVFGNVWHQYLLPKFDAILSN